MRSLVILFFLLAAAAPARAQQHVKPAEADSTPLTLSGGAAERLRSRRGGRSALRRLAADLLGDPSGNVLPTVGGGAANALREIAPLTLSGAAASALREIAPLTLSGGAAERLRSRRAEGTFPTLRELVQS